jgi:hypothetical protein
MRNISILLALTLAACSKKNTALVETEKSKDRKIEVCNFGLNNFNQAKRPMSETPYAEMKSPNKTAPAVTANSTIYIDFGGENVSNTIWNTNGNINCAAANLQPAEIEKIITRVTEDFSPFNVNVTTDETVYNATHPAKRMRVIVTETWEWFGIAGGIAYPGSFTWGNNTPAFVFSTLLFYNEKFIAEAISHEVGHTLGLDHQRAFTSTCSFLSEYNTGSGNGLTGWAPIMGNSYYHNITTWHKGPTTSCGNTQDDVSIVGSILGFKQDELDKMNRAPELTAMSEGIINNSSDEDYFSVDLKNGGSIVAAPHCLGDGVGANLHVKINVYHKNGTLISSSSDPNTLSATATLPAGKYYVGVQNYSATPDLNYGMLGRYTVQVL